MPKEARNMPKEARRDCNQTNSLVTAAIIRYPVSADDLETVTSFLVFYETGDPPRVTKYPVKEHLVRGHAPQSKSQKAEK